MRRRSIRADLAQHRLFTHARRAMLAPPRSCSLTAVLHPHENAAARRHFVLQAGPFSPTRPQADRKQSGRSRQAHKPLWIGLQWRGPYNRRPFHNDCRFPQNPSPQLLRAGNCYVAPEIIAPVRVVNSKWRLPTICHTSHSAIQRAPTVGGCRLSSLTIDSGKIAFFDRVHSRRH